VFETIRGCLACPLFNRFVGGDSGNVGLLLRNHLRFLPALIPQLFLARFFVTSTIFFLIIQFVLLGFMVFFIGITILRHFYDIEVVVLTH